LWYNSTVLSPKERKVPCLEAVKVRLIANAGVLVEYKGLRYLIDGIHTNDYLEFNGVPQNVLGEMLCGFGPLADIDYLLFTHEHIDHFMAGLTQTYVQNNRVQGMVLPAQGGGRLAALKEYADLTGVEYLAPVLADGESFRTTLGNADLVVAGMRHTGAQFRDVQSCSFLLNFEGKSLLFTGDSEHLPAWFASALAGTHTDVMFVNPLFYLNSSGQKIIENLAPSTVVIYHLAEAKDGVMSPFQRAVLRDAEKNAPLNYRLVLLDQMGQTELF